MAGLAFDVAYHIVIGLALAALVWGVGAGWVRGRGDALDGYPFGLLAVSAAALLFLVTPWLGLLGLALLAPVVRVRPPRIDIATLAWSAPAVLLLPTAFALMLHGPTRSLASAANGENLWWSNRIWSAAESVVPYRDLLAEGQRIIYVESGPSFVGAALSHLPGFDAILFNTTSLVVFMLVSVVTGLRLLGGGRQSADAWTPIVAIVALASLTYPSFPTESAPVTLALPLAFVGYRLWEQQMSFARLTTLSVVVGVDLLLTKVIAIVPLAIVLAFVLYDRYWTSLSHTYRIGILGVAAFATAVVIGVLFLTASWYRPLFELDFLPARAVSYLGDELVTRNAAKLAPTFQIVGEVALLVALVRARAVGIAAALGASVALSWFLTGQGFYMAVGFGMLLAALFFHFRKDTARALRAPLIVAAAALAAWSWMQDIAGVRVALVLLPLVWLAFVVGLTRRPPRAAVALGAALALVAWAAGGFRLEKHFDSLGPADYDVWQRVHEVVPAGGLVFTSLTGRAVTPHEGWNNYPSIAERQLYIAGWYDGRLVAHTRERDARLAQNRRVLSGAAAPDEVSGRFPSYWAVLRRSERPPSSFHRIYANDRFVLYRISS